MTPTSPLQKGAYEPVTWNFKLLAQHELDGFGGMGEGMAIQIAPDGRRILWLAHESAPKNFTAVDVSDPRKPKVVVQTDLPQRYMRSNSLETAATSWRSPTRPRSRAAAGRLRAVRHLGAGDSRSRSRSSTARGRSRAACISCGSATANTCTWRPARPTSQPTHPLDDQFYRCVDVRNPAKPVEVGRWWLPGTRAGRQRDAARRATAPPRQGLPRPQHQRLSAASRPLLSRLYRRRHVHPGHLRQGATRKRSAAGTTRRPIPASRTRCCRCSTAGCCS